MNRKKESRTTNIRRFNDYKLAKNQALKLYISVFLIIYHTEVLIY